MRLLTRERHLLRHARAARANGSSWHCRSFRRNRAAWRRGRRGPRAWSRCKRDRCACLEAASIQNSGTRLRCQAKACTGGKNAIVRVRYRYAQVALTRLRVSDSVEERGILDFCLYAAQFTGEKL